MTFLERRSANGPLALAFALGLSLVSPPSEADPAPGPTPSATARPAASTSASPTAFELYRDAVRASDRKDYVKAAQLFEQAHRLSPHHDVLWNVAQAWDFANEAERAATGYDRYLQEAPADAADRDRALRELKRLSAKVGRIDVIAAGFERVFVDDRPLVGARVYVTPGEHAIRGVTGDRALVKTTTVAAGEAVSVALVEDTPAGAATSATSAKPAPPPSIAPLAEPSPPLLQGWQRVAVGAGLAATAISGGLLLWSGVDTLQSRSAFDRESTPQALANGRDQQTRTNALVATTLALGAVTVAATVLFATVGRARVEARAAVRVEPSGAPQPSLSLHGSF